jgi:hypothetical protein
MIDDVYQAALGALEHHLKQSGAAYTLDDGELMIGSHRLGLSISFDDFVTQGDHVLAPLDIQIHVDGDNGDRFRVGTLGVGANRTVAVGEAVAEWHLLAAAPVLAALGASVENRRAAAVPQKLADWDLFPGRVVVRGRVPAELRAGGAFYRSLLDRLRQFVAAWETPDRFTLRSIYVLATCSADGREIQAAVDGILHEGLVEALSALPWPPSGETYLYKQLFVLRHGSLE